MQYLAIKQEEQNGKIVYVINAIPLKNKNKCFKKRNFTNFCSINSAKFAQLLAI